MRVGVDGGGYTQPFSHHIYQEGLTINDEASTRTGLWVISPDMPLNRAAVLAQNPATRRFQYLAMYVVSQSPAQSSIDSYPIDWATADAHEDWFLHSPVTTLHNYVPEPDFSRISVGAAPAVWSLVATGYTNGATSAAVDAQGWANLTLKTGPSGMSIPLGTVLNGHAVTVNIEIKAGKAAQHINVGLEDDWDGNGGQTFSQTFTNVGDTASLSVSWTPTADSTHARLYVWADATAGDTVSVRKSIVGDGTSVPTWADGDSAGWAWDGTAGQSSSHGTTGTPARLTSGPNYYLNIGKPAFQAAAVSWITSVLDRTGPWDGVFVDIVDLWQNINGTCSEYVGDLGDLSTWPNPWQQAILSWLGTLTSALHAYGIPAVVGNVDQPQRFVSPVDGVSKAVKDLCGTGGLDGIFDEAWGDGGLGAAQNAPFVTSMFKTVAWCQQNGKYFIGNNQSSASEPGRQQAYRYSLGMLLLGGAPGDPDDRVILDLSNSGTAGNVPWYPEYDVAMELGPALDDFVAYGDGTYARSFLNGAVTVNATGATARGVPAYDAEIFVSGTSPLPGPGIVDEPYVAYTIASDAPQPAASPTDNQPAVWQVVAPSGAVVRTSSEYSSAARAIADYNRGFYEMQQLFASLPPPDLGAIAGDGSGLSESAAAGILIPSFESVRASELTALTDAPRASLPTTLALAVAELVTTSLPGNLVANPSFEYDTLSGAPAAYTSDGTLSTFQVQSGWSASGTKSLRITAASVPGTLNALGAYSSQCPLTAGEPIFYAAELNVLALGTGVVALVGVKQSGLPGAIWDWTSVSTTGSIRLSRTVSIPGATWVEIYLGLVSLTGASNSGGDVYFDSAIVASGPVGAYVDGDQPGYGWAGTKGNSISVGRDVGATLAQTIRGSESSAVSDAGRISPGPVTYLARGSESTAVSDAGRTGLFVGRSLSEPYTLNLGTSVGQTVAPSENVGLTSVRTTGSGQTVTLTESVKATVA